MEKWERIKLSEVLKEKTERNKNNETDLVLSVTNSQGFVKQSDFFEGTVHSEDISNYKLVRKNEFAYNPSRINVGSIDILKDYDIGALSPMYVIFSVDENRLLPDYFKYYFQTHKFNENVKNNTQGSVRNSLSFKALSEFEYLLPPLEEQKRIVKILDQVNKVIEKYQNLINEKEQFIKSQFVEMFKDCTKKNLEEVAEIIMGQSPDSKSYNDLENGIPFLQGKGDYGKKYTRISHWTTEPSKIAEKGNILMSVRAPVGDVNIASERCCIGRGLCSINAKKNIMNNDFIFNALIATKDKIEAKGAGSTFNAITKKDVYEIQIPVATIELQNQFAEIVRLIDKQKFELEKQKQNYIDLKKGLMQQLLTGKLKVS